MNTWVKERANASNAWIRGTISSASTQLGIGYSPDPYGRKGRAGSNVAFLVMMLILLAFLWWLPISGSDTYNWNKLFQISNVVSTLCIFILMCFSLNLHTGYTGMVNFGVIFFVGMAINVHSDNVLINLRKPGEKGYGAPAHAALAQHT